MCYVCSFCNLYKGDFRSNEEDIRFGRLVLHPFRGDSESHFRLNSRSGLLEPLTTTGRFHIALLHLNRPALVALRLRKRRDMLRAAKIELLAAENRELRAILDAQRELLARLQCLLQSPDVQVLKLHIVRHRAGYPLGAVGIRLTAMGCRPA